MFRIGGIRALGFAVQGLLKLERLRVIGCLLAGLLHVLRSPVTWSHQAL